MADDINKDIKYLDKAGILDLTKSIFKTVNARIEQRMVNTVDEHSDVKHVPTAAAVYSAILNANHTRMVKVDDHTKVENPDNRVIYLEPVPNTANTYAMFVWDDLDDDGTYEWVALGASNVDFTNYWSKSEEDMAALKEALGVDETSQKVDVVDGKVTIITKTIEELQEEVSHKVDHDEVEKITQATVFKIVNDAANDTNPFAEPASSAAEVAELLTDAIESGAEEVSISLVSNIDLGTTAANVITIPAGVDVTVNIPNEVDISASNEIFAVEAGGNLTLNGAGTIVKVGKSTNSAVRVESGGTLTIDGITIDATTQGTTGNYSYGVYAKEGSTVNFKSGTVKVGQGSCISTNNTTGGAEINITGGELYSDGAYAIYQAAQLGVVNISGDAIVQGVNARMGTINVSGNAKIIPTTITDENRDDIGANIGTSGCIWFGDTIALVAGTYNESDNDTVLNISENATVESNFRSAIGVYMVDTVDQTNVTINAEDSSKVTTTDEEFEAFQVYDHDYISAAAAAAGKPYNPIATTNVSITADGKPIYPKQ